MKKQILTFISLFLALFLQAQVSKTIQIDTAGTLKNKILLTEAHSLTRLTIKGTLSPVDLGYIKYNMFNLEYLDLNGVTSIVAYTGDGATAPGIQIYNANEIPMMCFRNTIDTVLVSATAIITIDSFTGFKGIAIIDKNNSQFASSDGIVFIKDMTKIVFFPTTKTGSYSVPTNVVSIYPYAFSGAGITELHLSSSVKTIGYYAFAGSLLQKIYIPTSVNKFGTSVFSNCDSLKAVFEYTANPSSIILSSSSLFYSATDTSEVLYVPIGSLELYQKASGWKDFDHIKEFAELTASSDSKTVSLTTMGKWSVSSNVTWLSINTSSGNGNGTFTITSLPNNTASERIGVITILSDSTTALKSMKNSRTITVFQAGNGTATFAPTISSDNFIIYPNPTSSSFTVNTDKDALVQIFTTNGMLTYSKNIFGKELIPVNELQSGVYIVRIITKDSIISKSLIVK